MQTEGYMSRYVDTLCFFRGERWLAVCLFRNDFKLGSIIPLTLQRKKIESRRAKVDCAAWALQPTVLPLAPVLLPQICRDHSLGSWVVTLCTALPPDPHSNNLCAVSSHSSQACQSSTERCEAASHPQAEMNQEGWLCYIYRTHSAETSESRERI